MIVKGMPVVSLHTLGCKLNQAETESLSRQFVRAGYSIAENEVADVFVVNTCTVTHIADRKARHLLRFLRKNNPQALIVATGCYGEREASALSKAGADLVTGNQEKAALPEIISLALSVPKTNQDIPESWVGGDRVRSFIKIQDGCQHFCTYCIVPFIRAKEFSVLADEVMKEINNRISSGYREVVLTGTRIGIYKDSKIDLIQLVKKILQETAIGRLHLSSLQPREITDKLLQIWADSRLCQHFHIALQSGSQSVLERMQRDYTLTDFKNAVTLIRKSLPEAAVTTDIMVGFPGETDEEFSKSYRFCQEVGFAALHVFTYSPRPGTRAASMQGKVADNVKKERSKCMLALARQSSNSFRENFIGRRSEVLFENKEKPGSALYSGFSQNYIRVYTRSEHPLTNALKHVQLVRKYLDGLWGDTVK